MLCFNYCCCYTGILDAFRIVYFGQMPNPVTDVYSTNGSQFNKTSSLLQTSSPALFWFHNSINLNPNTTGLSRLSSSITVVDIFTNSCQLPFYDTVSRDNIISAVQKQSSFSLQLLGDLVSIFSWSGFRLDNLLRPLIAFSVARSGRQLNASPYLVLDMVSVKICWWLLKLLQIKKMCLHEYKVIKKTLQCF